jgi:hypothetical protein
MHALQHTMLLAVHLADPLPSGRAPGQEHHAPAPLRRHGVDDLLREALPAVVRVRVRLVGADRQAGVEQEDAAVGPGGEEAASVRGRGEVGVVVLEAFVDVG